MEDAYRDTLEQDCSICFLLVWNKITSPETFESELKKNKMGFGMGSYGFLRTDFKDKDSEQYCASVLFI